MSEQYLDSLKQGSTAERICALILERGDIDGSHHKQWILDQVLRLAAGERYTLLIAIYEDVTGQDWDEGIAP